MPVQIGARRDSGFDDPLGMLADCHRRIERFLKILDIVCQRAKGRALSEEEASAVKASLDYFRNGGRRHTADEEESLFPRLRGRLSASDFKEIDSLEHEHQSADTLHAEIDELYMRWISAGTVNEAETSRLVSAVAELVRMYAAHIRLEEDVVFPRAAHLLDAPGLQAMGEEFRRRRA